MGVLGIPCSNKPKMFVAKLKGLMPLDLCPTDGLKKEHRAQTRYCRWEFPLTLNVFLRACKCMYIYIYIHNYILYHIGHWGVGEHIYIYNYINYISYHINWTLGYGTSIMKYNESNDNHRTYKTTQQDLDRSGPCDQHVQRIYDNRALPYRCRGVGLDFPTEFMVNEISFPMLDIPHNPPWSSDDGCHNYGKSPVLIHLFIAKSFKNVSSAQSCSQSIDFPNSEPPSCKAATWNRVAWILTKCTAVMVLMVVGFLKDHINDSNKTNMHITSQSNNDIEWYLNVFHSIPRVLYKSLGRYRYGLFHKSI